MSHAVESAELPTCAGLLSVSGAGIETE